MFLELIAMNKSFGQFLTGFLNFMFISELHGVFNRLENRHRGNVHL